MSGAAIEVVGLAHAWPDATPALRGVSFRVAPGEALAVVGPNGAGKSTLLLHLNGTLLPAAGEVRVDGVTVARRTLPAVRRAVGMVFQDPDDQLFLPTVGEDVAFGARNLGLPPAEVEERVRTALARTGASHLEGRPPWRLSAGEKRAVSIATVLAMAPGAIVMDEPSAHLDPRGRRRLIDLLRSLPQTRVLATHDLDLSAEVCSRVLFLDSGRVVADGPAAEVLADDALLLAHGLERPRGGPGRPPPPRG